MDKRGFNKTEAMHYLGVKRDSFERYFQPNLAAVRIGTSLLFDRFDLDRVYDMIKSGNERLIRRGEVKWADKVVSIKIPKTGGVLIKSTKALDFESVLTTLKKQKIG